MKYVLRLVRIVRFVPGVGCFGSSSKWFSSARNIEYRRVTGAEIDEALVGRELKMDVVTDQHRQGTTTVGRYSTARSGGRALLAFVAPTAIVAAATSAHGPTAQSETTPQL